MDGFMEDKLYEAARVKDTEIPSYSNDGFILCRTPDEDCNALHIASRYRNVGFIEKVLTQFPAQFYHLLYQTNSRGETPFHLAAQFGDMKTVKALVAADDKNRDQQKPCWSMWDNKGDTPLHKALRYRHEDIALLLLQRNKGLVSHCNCVGESLAYLAADNFCLKFLQAILEYSSHHDQNNVSFSGPLGQTVFHPARKLTGDVMSILIEKRRGMLNVQDTKGKTVLHYAVEEKRELIVKILLEAKSSLAYLRDCDGLTPLHRAAKMGLPSMIQIISELSPQSIFIRTSQGQTALHVAKMDAPSSFLGCIRNTRMKELINVADDEGNTPLHLASKNSNLDIVDALLEVSGINWRLRNNDGYTPMDLFSSDEQFPSKLRLLESEWKEKEVVNMNIFHHKDVKNLEDLLKSYDWEELMSYRGHKGNNIFHIAARNGCEEIINKAHDSSSACLLLLSGENSKGENPLHIAAEYGQLEAVTLILERSISTDESGNEISILVQNGHDEYEEAHFKPWRMKSTDGDTPLHKAVRNGHVKVALHLLSCDHVLASYVNEASESILYLAAQSQSYAVVKELLKEDGNYRYSISGPDGKTPLHTAAINSDPPYIATTNAEISETIIGSLQYVLRDDPVVKNFNLIMGRLPGLVNKVDDEGKTPLHYAVEQRKPLIVKELLKRDKSAAFIYDNEGFTPLLRATTNGFHQCVVFMLLSCPHSAELRGVINDGTVLHLIKNTRGDDHLPNHILEKIDYLFNETDRDGNTALHRAILDGNIAWGKYLVLRGGTNRRVKNNNKQTPSTLCNELIKNGDLSQVTLYSTFRDPQNAMIQRITNRIEPWINFIWAIFYKSIKENFFEAGSYIEGMKEEELKQFVNNMSLTATLLVTLTFAAAFTVPGGYDQTNGQVLRINQVAVRLFLVFDVVAMLMGMAALFTYTFGSASRKRSLKEVATEGAGLIKVSLLATIGAFTAGIYALAFNHALEAFILAVCLAPTIIGTALLY